MAITTETDATFHRILQDYAAKAAQRKADELATIKRLLPPDHTLVIEFSGGNDEGGADSIYLLPVNALEGRKPVLAPELETVASSVPSWRYGSFATEFSVHGAVQICHHPTASHLLLIKWSGQESSWTNFSDDELL